MRVLAGIVMLVTALAQAGTAPVRGEEGERAAPPAGGGITRIQGRVLEGRRRPVVGASVAVRDEGAAGILYLTTTGEDGGMRVLGIPDGSYRVVFRKAGYETVEKTDVTVRMPLRAVLEVPMARTDGAVAPATSGGPGIEGAVVDVRGEIVGASGTPVPDVRVRLVRADGSVDPRMTRTGPDGTFSFEGLAAGAWDAEVLGVGFLPIRVPLSVDRPLAVTARLVPQPTDYVASPLDLMPPEEPVAPPDLAGAPATVEIGG